MAHSESSVASTPSAGRSGLAGLDAYRRRRARRGPCAALFLSSEWRVSDRSNRTGYRLAGPPLPVLPSPDRLSEPVAPGLIQLPPRRLPTAQLRRRWAEPASIPATRSRSNSMGSCALKTVTSSRFANSASRAWVARTRL